MKNNYKTGLNIKTFEARALIGASIGYSSELITKDELKFAIKQVAEEMKNYVFSGNITETEIIVAGNKKKYNEQAFLIETSIYPRFPAEKEEFKRRFVEFIGSLAVALKQERIAIRFSDESLMLETKYCKNPDLK